MKRLFAALPLISAFLAGACVDMPPAPQSLAGGPATTQQTVDDGYVDLPAGRYHKSCVYEVGNDDRFDSKNSTITRADGSKLKIPPCKYPTLDSRLRRGRRGSNRPTYHGSGWREAIEGQTIAVNSLRRLTAQWTVPANASYNNSTTYYTFPGIENPDPGQADPDVYILQPVLGYSHGSWFMTSFRCNDGSNCVSSPHVTVQPGDPILGVVDTPFGCNLFCEFWVVTKNERTGQQTRLIVQNDLDNYVRYIGAAVETFAMTNCSQYPQGGVNYSSIRVWDNAGEVNPYWNTYYGDISLGCNFGIQYTTGQVSTAFLNHGVPQPVFSASISGPTMVNQYMGGTWYASVGGTGATPPYTFQWGGVLSGSGDSISGTPQFSDYLLLYVWDSAGHYTSTSIYVTVCEGMQLSC